MFAGLADRLEHELGAIAAIDQNLDSLGRKLERDVAAAAVVNRDVGYCAPPRSKSGLPSLSSQTLAADASGAVISARAVRGAPTAGRG